MHAPHSGEMSHNRLRKEPELMGYGPAGPRAVLRARGERGRVLQRARLPAAVPHQCGRPHPGPGQRGHRHARPARALPEPWVCGGHTLPHPNQYYLCGATSCRAFGGETVGGILGRRQQCCHARSRCPLARAAHARPRTRAGRARTRAASWWSAPSASCAATRSRAMSRTCMRRSRPCAATRRPAGRTCPPPTSWPPRSSGCAG